MKRTKNYFSAGLIVLCLIVPCLVLAGTITYQAKLKDTAGDDIEGPVTVGFRIYDTVSGSTVMWGETQALTATKGVISVELGKVNPLPENLFNNPELYIGITVTGDPEMTPRSRLVSTWKAMSASKASGKAVQAGGATLNVTDAPTGSVPVTFPKAFQAPPVVMVGAPRDNIGGKSFIPTRVTDITTTTCTVHFQSLDGSNATGSTDFDWIAIGE
jgi:hypothetical protein